MTLPILLRSFLSSFPLSICFSSVSLSLSTIDSRIDQSDSSESLVFSDNIAELWILVIPEKLDKFSRFLKKCFPPTPMARWSLIRWSPLRETLPSYSVSLSFFLRETLYLHQQTTTWRTDMSNVVWNLCVQAIVRMTCCATSLIRVVWAISTRQH